MAAVGKGRREREEEKEKDKEQGKRATEKPEKEILQPRALMLPPPRGSQAGGTLLFQGCSPGGGACICPLHSP